MSRNYDESGRPLKCGYCKSRDIKRKGDETAVEHYCSNCGEVLAVEIEGRFDTELSESEEDSIDSILANEYA